MMLCPRELGGLASGDGRWVVGMVQCVDRDRRFTFISTEVSGGDNRGRSSYGVQEYVDPELEPSEL